MKKRVLLVGLLALVLVGGCAALQTVTDFICNPTAEQQATAAAMLDALDKVQAVVAMFYPPAAIAQASAVLTTIKGGGCFLVAELTKIFEMLDKAEEAKALAKGMKAPAKDTYPALRKYVK